MPLFLKKSDTFFQRGIGALRLLINAFISGFESIEILATFDRDLFPHKYSQGRPLITPYQAPAHCQAARIIAEFARRPS
jgi:hypothetical protein